ncbi:MAG TPA: hypothetical protein VF014_14955 [Casimicrobiaceae bacterium]|nr:hypothetical protein [Casimicrobiaceae bacterium]
MTSFIQKHVFLAVAATAAAVGVALAPALHAAPADTLPGGPSTMDHSGMPMPDHAMPGQPSMQGMKHDDMKQHGSMTPEMMEQHRQMMARMHGQMQAGVPAMPGQDAFGAIQEIVRMLESDPKTDWSKIDLEALRQHLIDMNEVALRAEAASKPIDGGLEIAVTGSGRTLAAIQRMVPAHVSEIDGLSGWSAKTELLADGVRFTVTSKVSKEVQHIRGLGFIGILVSGSHHQPHHLAMARGEFAYGQADHAQHTH